MKNVDMENKIKQAFEHAAPNVLESVLSDCREQKGTVILMNEKKNNWTKRLVAVAAALALVIGMGAGAGLYRTNRAVAATVSLDVNPSVELAVNRKDRVLAVNANNEDGKTIIGDMDLTGSDLNVAMNALVGSMVRNGYLNELANSVLVSVDSKDAAVGTALQEKLAQEISVILEGDHFSGAVISQTVEKTEDLTHQAQEHHISVGKANLIRQIIDQDSRYTFEDLADRSINELKLISQSPTIQLEHASEVGNASEKEYIGRDAALQAALDQLNIKIEDITAKEIGLDFDDGVMVYEVELIYKGREYEFEIDARTGASLYDVQFEPAEPDDGDFSSTVKPNGDLIGSDQAKEAAFNHAGVKASEAKNIKCELDRDDGTIRYDVDFHANGYEFDYEIDAITGNVIKSEKEKDDDAGVQTTKVTEASSNETTDLIGKDKAKQIALDHAGVKAANAKAMECELDRERNTAVYEVEFVSDGYEYSYEINATTGKVISQEKERND